MFGIFKKNRLNLKSWRGFIALLAFLFLFHATPSSYAIFHTMVHQKGVEHHHTDLPQHHSHEDHTSGKSQDPIFQTVLALQNSSPSLSKGGLTSSKIHNGDCLPITFLYPASPSLIQKYFFESGHSPPFKIFKFFHSNRAPPIA